MTTNDKQPSAGAMRAAWAVHHAIFGKAHEPYEGNIRDYAAVIDRELGLPEVEKALDALREIAAYVTMDEGDREATEENLGISMEEAVEMAHDNMIFTARGALKRLNDKYGDE